MPSTLDIMHQPEKSRGADKGGPYIFAFRPTDHRIDRVFSMRPILDIVLSATRSNRGLSPSNRLLPE